MQPPSHPDELFAELTRLYQSGEGCDSDRIRDLSTLWPPSVSGVFTLLLAHAANQPQVSQVCRESVLLPAQKKLKPEALKEVSCRSCSALPGSEICAPPSPGIPSPSQEGSGCSCGIFALFSHRGGQTVLSCLLVFQPGPQQGRSLSAGLLLFISYVWYLCEGKAWKGLSCCHRDLQFQPGTGPRGGTAMPPEQGHTISCSHCCSSAIKFGISYHSHVNRGRDLCSITSENKVRAHRVGCSLWIA